MTAAVARTPLTPIHVTAMALVCGVLAGLCMARGTHLWLIAGTALLHLSFLLDNVDGELARLTRRTSQPELVRQLNGRLSQAKLSKIENGQVQPDRAEGELRIGLEHHFGQLLAGREIDN